MDAVDDAGRRRISLYDGRYLSPLNTIRTKRTQALSLEERLQNLMERRLRDGRHRLALYVEQMKGLSPSHAGYPYRSTRFFSMTCACRLPSFT